jgi:raffinose/stachyose/melibiose transport system substrate-binding protein
MTLKLTRRVVLTVAAALTFSTAMTGASQAQTSLTFLVDNADASVAWAEQLVADFEALNPDIKITIETRPGGTDGDNIVKTRLATGEMTDIFNYNAGSLFQAINPIQNLVDLNDEPWEADVLTSFQSVVTAPDGHVYGAPFGAAMGGGVLYNKKIYADLGLSIPKDWATFMANSEKVKAAGKTGVIQSFADSWTAQLFVLGDYFNVQAAVPDFAEKYTANQIKYATTPAAMRGFEHGKEVFDAGFLNADASAATLDDALRQLATGEGAHYPMLTFAISNIQANYPENLNDVGFFAIPGDNAASNGLTVWMPSAVYIAKTSQHQAEAKKFVAYLASVAGCDSLTKAGAATGPYLVKGCELPADVPAGVADLLPYFQAEGTTAPALEFVSPVKGPNLSQITVEVGSGIRSPEDGAALYDEDVKKQAQQLGLAGW